MRASSRRTIRRRHLPDSRADRARRTTRPPLKSRARPRTESRRPPPRQPRVDGAAARGQGRPGRRSDGGLLPRGSRTIPTRYIAHGAGLLRRESWRRRPSRCCRTRRTSFPTETGITFELGAVLDKQKKYAESEAVFRQLITQGPGERRGPELPGLHAGRTWRAAERIGRLHQARARDRSRQRVVSGQHRLGVLQGRQARSRARSPEARRRHACSPTRWCRITTATCCSALAASTTRSPRGTRRSRAISTRSIAATSTRRSAARSKSFPKK